MALFWYVCILRLAISTPHMCRPTLKEHSLFPFQFLAQFSATVSSFMGIALSLSDTENDNKRFLSKMSKNCLNNSISFRIFKQNYCARGHMSTIRGQMSGNCRRLLIISAVVGIRRGGSTRPTSTDNWQVVINNLCQRSQRLSCTARLKAGAAVASK